MPALHVGGGRERARMQQRRGLAAQSSLSRARSSDRSPPGHVGIRGWHGAPTTRQASDGRQQVQGVGHKGCASGGRVRRLRPVLSAAGGEHPRVLASFLHGVRSGVFEGSSDRSLRVRSGCGWRHTAPASPTGAGSCGSKLVPVVGEKLASVSERGCQLSAILQADFSK